MFEYDCATVPIERKERLSPPSTKINEDFEYLIITPELRRIAATTFLAFVTYTAPFGHLELAHSVTPPTNIMIMDVVEGETSRIISLSQARRFARQIQNRIDAQYQNLLEAEYKSSVVWEEDL